MATIDGGLEETTATRSTTSDRSGNHAGSHVGATVTRPRGRPYSREVNWRLFALVGASVAAGAALGAGIALLTAPQSGGHTRLALARELRRHRPWKRSPWDKLGDNLNTLVERRNKRSHRRERQSV
jgi:hypothetical protein